jgi:hypothetical protein
MCVQDQIEILASEINKLSKRLHTVEAVLVKWLERELFSDEIDDHTSVWGGAGPDCITVRREAAYL